MAATDVAPSRLGRRRARGPALPRRPCRRSVSVGVMVFNETPDGAVDRRRPTTPSCARALTGWRAARPHRDRRRDRQPALKLLDGAPEGTRPPAAIVCSRTAARPTAPTRSRPRSRPPRQHIPRRHGRARHAERHDQRPGPQRHARSPCPCRPTPSCSRRSRARPAAAYAVQDASRLNAVYAQLGAKLGHQPRQARRSPPSFAGAALLLLLLGSALSLRWFGRLI